MILAIDVGNTNIVIGCCKDGKVLFSDRISTNHAATALEYAAAVKAAFDFNGIGTGELHGAIISSVVPSVTTAVSGAAERFTGKKPMIIGPGIKTGLSILIDNPAQLGSDLVVDAVAGIAEYPLPLVIIDMG
ncbi:MAG: type III pantothenate kinase, partial [Ruminococcus sp.]|nr:type III pantothenate kinase [Ruminococcus sp.]